MNITNSLVHYIHENRISVSQVSADTKIPQEKLKLQTKDVLSAEEMLVLCQYLHVKPEDFMDSNL